VSNDHIATVKEAHQASTEALEAIEAIVFELELLGIANLTVIAHALEKNLEFGLILHPGPE
jgi:hypothetical protein